MGLIHSRAAKQRDREEAKLLKVQREMLKDERRRASKPVTAPAPAVPVAAPASVTPVAATELQASDLSFRQLMAADRMVIQARRAGVKLSKPEAHAYALAGHATFADATQPPTKGRRQDNDEDDDQRAMARG
jgi:hypothetical protein